MAPASIERIHQCCFDNLANIGTSPGGMYNFIRKNRLAIIHLVLNCQLYGEMNIRKRNQPLLLAIDRHLFPIVRVPPEPLNHRVNNNLLFNTYLKRRQEGGKY
jgi:hypothetical protein